MPRKTELPVADDRGVRIRLPPPAGLSWCGALLSAVVRGSTAPFLGSSLRGTEGSNPSPSTIESGANLTFGAASHLSLIQTPVTGSASSVGSGFGVWVSNDTQLAGLPVQQIDLRFAGRSLHRRAAAFETLAAPSRWIRTPGPP